ncbi:MAG: hypothetical protein H0U74_12610, partial [Bradymonadaceae bacterium]|nr:hypothetical protein [Lujinxingiaceae bacterium]
MNTNTRRPSSPVSLMRRGGLFLLLAFVTAAFASCGFDDQEGFLEIDDDLEIRVQE